jgi:hypothetical protein
MSTGHHRNSMTDVFHRALVVTLSYLLASSAIPPMIDAVPLKNDTLTVSRAKLCKVTASRSFGRAIKMSETSTIIGGGEGSN